MKSPVMKLSQNLQIDRTLPELLQKRLKHAQEEFAGALRAAQAKSATMLPALLAPGTTWNDYAVDFAQRAILFWDTMRQRGNNFREHQKKGLPPPVAKKPLVRRAATTAKPKPAARARTAAGQPAES